MATISRTFTTGGQRIERVFTTAEDPVGPPTITIVSPTSGQVVGGSHDGGDNVLTEGSVTDADTIELQINGGGYNQIKNIGVNNDWIFFYNTTDAGDITLDLRATGPGGTVIESVTWVYDHSPDATITSPVDGASFPPGTTSIPVTLAVDYWDSTNFLAISVVTGPANNPTAVDHDGITSHNIPINDGPGAYTLVADTFGGQSNSGNSPANDDNIAFTIDAAPTVTIDAPTDGSTFVAGTTAVIVSATPTATTHPIADVEFSTDGGATWASGAVAGSAYDFTVATADNQGYAVLVRSVDDQGNLSDEQQVTFSVGAFTPPIVDITSPTSGQELAAGTTSVTVAATVTPGTYPIATVEYSLNGNPSQASPTFTVADGQSYVIQALATDDQGNPSMIDQVSFSVAAADVDPTIVMVEPVNGATFPAAQGTVVVETIATAGSHPISVVSFSVNGGAFEAGTLIAGRWTYSVSVAANTSYTVSARATDTQGSSSTLVSTGFSTEPASPEVTIVSPTPATSFAAGTTSVLLQASAVDGSNPVTAVEFSTDSGQTWLGGTFNGTFWEATLATTDGGYSALARALDGVGTQSAFQATSFFVGDITTRIDTPDAATQLALQKTVRCILRKVEVYNSDGSPYDLNASFENFTVSVDKSRPERRTLTLTLRDEGNFGEDPTQLWYDKVIKVYRGFDVDGVEYLPLIGTFLLDRTARNHFGNRVTVTGRDLSKQLSFEFGVYEEYAINTPIENVIRDIALAGGLDPARIVLPLTGVSISKELVYESTGRRWDAMRQLADSYNFDLFFDADGRLRMFEHPRLVGDPVQWTFETGTNSNIGAFEKQLTDAPIRNQVTVIGSSDLTDFPPPSGQATNQANGSTAANLIGLRPVTLERPEIHTSAECQDLAERLLEDYSKEQLNVSAEVMATPWLDANILVVFDRGDVDDFSEVTRYILDSFQISSEGGTMPASLSRLQT